MIKNNIFENIPSSQISLYSAKNDLITSSDFSSKLLNSNFKIDKLKTYPAITNKDNTKNNWLATFDVLEYDLVYSFTINFTQNPTIDMEDYQSKDSDLYDSQMVFAYELAVETNFLSYYSDEWHRQIKIISLFSNKNDIVADHNSMLYFTNSRIQFLSKLPAAPCFSNLYKQDVLNEGFFWIHTHGLSRCYGIELEVMGLKSFDNSISAVLDCAVSHLLTGAMQLNSKRIELGPGTVLKMMPWQEILKYFSSDVVGGIMERQDELHRQNSLVLYVKASAKTPFAALDSLIPNFFSGKSMLAYPAYVQVDNQKNALFLWQKLLRFVDTFGGKIRLKFLNKSMMTWSNFIKLEKDFIVINIDGNTDEISIKERQIIDWRLILEEDVYSLEDFFKLSENVL